MLGYIIKRIVYMLMLLLVLSIVSFILIQLPPGDYLSSLIQSLRDRGVRVDEEQIRALEDRYGLNLPLHKQYFKWFWNLLHGDMGRSFQWNEPVTWPNLIINGLIFGAIYLMLVCTFVIGWDKLFSLFRRRLEKPAEAVA